MQVPCGQCIGCRLARSQEWAVRCVHEAQLHDENCFVTLTYDDSELPQFGELRKDHFQCFMKRLRKSISPKRVRFFHCGEYGETNQRPHYHALLFGYAPNDREVHSERDGVVLYTSTKLAALWGKGFVTIGEVTFESAAYVARYTMKKLNGERYFAPLIDFSTGEIFELENVYATMSRNPGIGNSWFKDFKSDVFPDDFVVLNGRRYRPPRYYGKLLEATHSEEYEEMKQRRQQVAKERAEDNTTERLVVREEVQHAKVNKLVRTL